MERPGARGTHPRLGTAGKYPWDPGVVEEQSSLQSVDVR